MALNDFDPAVLRDSLGVEGPLSLRVYASIREAILSMALRPGVELKKPDICARFNVSRAPVSEALMRLSHEGLVEIVPQSGTRVSRLSMPEIRQSQFIREALEVATAGKVAAERTEEQLARLTRSLRLQQVLVAEGDLDGFYEHDEEFHAILSDCTGYPRLSDLTDVISAQVMRARRLILPTQGRAEATLEEHQAIARAIRERDVEAAKAAMQQHLSQLIPRLEQLLADQPDLFGGNTV